MKKTACMVAIFACCLIPTSSCASDHLPRKGAGNLVEAAWGVVDEASGVLARESEPEDSETTLGGQGRGIGVITGWRIDLDDPIGTFTDFYVTEKLALEIGDAVLRGYISEEELAKMTLTVRDIPGRDFYVVSRFYKGVAGGDYNVAINKEDGKILRIWMGE